MEGSKGVIIKPWDILVVDGLPNDLPRCAGLISSVAQPPLCHTALLCQCRGIPNMCLRGIFDVDNGGRGEGHAQGEQADRDRFAQLRLLDNKWVRLKVDRQRYDLEGMEKEKAIEEWAMLQVMRQGRGGISLEGDVTKKSLIGVGEKLSQRGRIAVGAKASQYADLHNVKLGSKLEKHVQAAQGVMVPFYYYNVYMRGLGMPQLLREIVAASEEAAGNVDDIRNSQYCHTKEDKEKSEMSVQEVDDDDEVVDILSSMSSLGISEEAPDRANASLLSSSSVFFDKSDTLSTSLASRVESLCETAVNVLRNGKTVTGEASKEAEEAMNTLIEGLLVHIRGWVMEIFYLLSLDV